MEMIKGSCDGEASRPLTSCAAPLERSAPVSDPAGGSEMSPLAQPSSSHSSSSVGGVGIA